MVTKDGSIYLFVLSCWYDTHTTCKEIIDSMKPSKQIIYFCCLLKMKGRHTKNELVSRHTHTSLALTHSYAHDSYGMKLDEKKFDYEAFCYQIVLNAICHTKHSFHADCWLLINQTQFLWDIIIVVVIVTLTFLYFRSLRWIIIIIFLILKKFDELKLWNFPAKISCFAYKTN